MSDTNFKAAVQLILQASAEGKPKHEVVLNLGATPQFLIDNGFPELPLSIKGKPVAMIYADKDRPGEIEISEQELALLRTLRNQALLAIKQAG